MRRRRISRAPVSGTAYIIRSYEDKGLRAMADSSERFFSCCLGRIWKYNERYYVIAWVPIGILSTPADNSQSFVACPGVTLIYA